MRLLDSHYSILTTQKGFTLLELILFMGIFVLVVIGFITTFVAVARIQVRQSAAAEVAAQSQFVLQAIQREVERSSLIEMAADTATSTLRLRMASSSEDIVQIEKSGDAIVMRVASSSALLATNAARTLTSNKVKVTNLAFTMRTNYPGHHTVAVSFAMENNTTNATRRFANVLRLGVLRVSAATFDSNVVPGTSNTYSLGASAGDWRSVNNTLYFSGSNVGVGISSPTARLHVSGGDIYVDSSAYGLVLKAPNGSCYRLSVSNGGAATTTSATCP